MYAMRRDDPRFAVPKGEKCRVIACPGCRSAIRIWAPGCDPSERNPIKSYVIVALVIAAIVAGLIYYNSQVAR